MKSQNNESLRFIVNAMLITRQKCSLLFTITYDAYLYIYKDYARGIKILLVYNVCIVNMFNEKIVRYIFMMTSKCQLHKNFFGAQ